MDWIELGGKRFEKCRAIIALASDAGLDLSEWTVGVLCNEMLAKFNITLDYANRRVRFSVPEKPSTNT